MVYHCAMTINSTLMPQSCFYNQLLNNFGVQIAGQAERGVSEQRLLQGQRAAGQP